MIYNIGNFSQNVFCPLTSTKPKVNLVIFSFFVTVFSACHPDEAALDWCPTKLDENKFPLNNDSYGTCRENCKGSNPL